MLTHLLLELSPAAKILTLKLHTRKSQRIALDNLREAVDLKCPSRHLHLGIERLLTVGLRPIAATNHNQQERPPKMTKPQIKDAEATHGETDDVRPLDRKIIEDRDRVNHRSLLQVPLRLHKHVEQ